MSKHYKVVLFLILTISILFRVVNLGYSNFQGDEISAQNFLFGETNFKDFLLTRSIPPGQYIVSFITNGVFKNIDPHLRVRFPFNLANIGVLIFILLLQKEKSFISLTLFGLSGLMLAFSRIVQYQSFIMLFGLGSIFFVDKYLKTKKDLYLYIASLISTLAILFHYDSLSYIIPISLFLLVKKDFGALLKYTIPIVSISSLFFIPFFTRVEFLKTWKYLTQKRIISNLSYDAVNYSTLILSIYHSREYLIILTLALFLYVIKIIKTSGKVGGVLLGINVVLITLRALSQERKEFLIYISVVTFVAYIILRLKRIFRSKRQENRPLVEIWFLISFLFYSLIIQMPLTHIYTFLLPLFILVSGTLYKNRLLTLLFTILIVSSISFNYQAFIDTKSEYPWESKRYLFGNMPQKILGGKKISGIFGFPYYRNWQEIENTGKNLITEKGYIKYYSNEKYRISKYYMQGIRWDSEYPDYYIYIENPQSLSIATQPNHLDIIKEGNKFTIYETK